MSKILALLSGGFGGWIIAGVCALLLLGGTAGGWALHGAFDGTKVAKAQTATAKCEVQHQTALATINGYTAQDLADGIAKARAADAQTISDLKKRNAAYAAALMEANNVPPNPHPAICVDPEPWRTLLHGLRDADAAAAGNGGGGDASGAAQH